MNVNNFVKSFSEIFPRCQNSKDWVYLFLKEFPKCNIHNLNRAAAFIAQCGHETAGFTIFEENLNYSAESLLKVFPKYFKDKDVTVFARKPNKIASLVYANRMGNGDETSGDGWTYRGRGLIQLTGKRNYELCSKFCDIDLVKDPDLVAKNPEIALKSALWFWTRNNLNALCDKPDFKRLTIKINGGLNGFTEREHLYRLCLDKFRNYF